MNQQSAVSAAGTGINARLEILKAGSCVMIHILPLSPYLPKPVPWRIYFNYLM